ncbi:acyltransferase [Corallococcus sp. CA053C]|uniref:acyltransferase family protein n=1 Tax=Corallococcus sp. CA053C TaxID=2316732 RepID=UPI000EA39632|nr:acyltransferase [Corallococcus sp. CA053C]RKH05638.1 acyltransferase [Corallococcus sp. CA053C]
MSPQPPSASLSSRLPGLDTLRVFAILGVVGRHYPHTGAPAWFAETTRFGWTGVDLFFVLSGFLIGRQLLEPIAAGERPQLLSFYLRRLFRILPSYWAVLALYALVPTVRGAESMGPLWKFLTFTQNIGFEGGPFGHAWSLCVEEQFYLVLPLLILALAPRVGVRGVGILSLGLIAAGVLLRSFAWESHLASVPEGVPLNPIYWKWVYWPTWNRMDGLLAGVLLALVHVFRPVVWERWRRAPLCSGLLALVSLSLAWPLCAANKTLLGCAVLFPVLAVGFAALVVFAASDEGARTLGRMPGARWLASMTYCMYLTHTFTKNLALDAMEKLGWGPFHPATVLAYVGCLLAASTLLHVAVERPFLRLREYWMRSSRAHPFPRNDAERTPGRPPHASLP